MGVSSNLSGMAECNFLLDALCLQRIQFFFRKALVERARLRFPGVPSADSSGRCAGRILVNHPWFVSVLDAFQDRCRARLCSADVEYRSPGHGRSSYALLRIHSSTLLATSSFRARHALRSSAEDCIIASVEVSAVWHTRYWRSWTWPVCHTSTPDPRMT